MSVEIKGGEMKERQRKEKRERVVRTEICWPRLTQGWCQADLLMEHFSAPKQMVVYVLDLFAIKTAGPCCCVCVCVSSLSL